MPIIDLALDISQMRTGAVWDGADGVPRATSFKAPASLKGDGGGYSLGAGLLAYHNFLVDLIMVTGAERITFEAPLPLAAWQKWDEKEERMRPRTSQLTMQILLNLAGITEMCAARAGIHQCFQVTVQSARKAMLGKGKWDKEDVQAMCRQLRWPMLNADQADAAAVWYAAKVTCDPLWRPAQGLVLFQEGVKRK